ncbi:MAG: fibrobacter succinogenes major paralogous domain-containing protein [Dysgonamonadaceae bacterium]|nr:fibrobacter succinogenes major paralogous domain-containing protein [Dysgonamonadaceae bacterium]
MKKILLTMTAFIMLSASCASAQVTIGELKDPESFSILELVSTDRGLRLPQMSNANKNDVFGTDNATLIAAGDDALGLQIFNTTTLCVETWNGTEWILACACPQSVTDGQNTYSVGYFGAAGCWMTENLRTKTKSYGGGIADLSENPGESTTAPYYSYPTEGYGSPTDAKFTAHPEYGLLYNWVAASGRTGVSTADVDGVGSAPDTDATKHQGICPDGWHLPSDYEWNRLDKEIANASLNSNKYGIENTTLQWDDSWYTNDYRGDHGKIMKSSTAVAGTNILDPVGYSNTPANNGFNALLVGYVEGGSADDYGSKALFWSSSSGVTGNAWFRIVLEGDAGVGRYEFGNVFLFSVRCKKNEN